MWLWESELRALGFRRKAERYWLCGRRFGLPSGDHLSLYCWGEQVLPGQRLLVELTEFHATFHVAGERVHFYYHERLENVWEPGGHTSSGEILRLGQDPAALRAEADGIAARFVEALSGRFLPRVPPNAGE